MQQPLSATQYQNLCEELKPLLINLKLSCRNLRSTAQNDHFWTNTIEDLVAIEKYIHNLPRKHCDHASVTERIDRESGMVIESSYWCLVKNIQCCFDHETIGECQKKWERSANVRKHR